MSTMSELVEVFLEHLGGGYTEIRKVEYRSYGGSPTRHRSALLNRRCRKQKRRWIIQSLILNILQVLDLPPLTFRKVVIVSQRLQELDVPVTSFLPLPIPRLEDVPCFFQQLDLDEGACADPFKAGMCNDYNTDGSAELRVGHMMRNREAVQTAVKNYSIRRNAEYRVIESDKTKYHCRCKHAEDGCPWTIWVALRQNLGYWEVR
ncbi:hypothetical protein PIB30_038420 [Stylosanthes scabra]|uniref:Transposase MuDR plant domain-containing protein n=1 Tax=Stylosanthes scabra TaxID=79078 RepID=A0ABU6VFV5_9FABA|nr:hypothetical protein [Stylosanthes scabra]